jgi:hypothetical protein
MLAFGLLMKSVMLVLLALVLLVWALIRFHRKRIRVEVLEQLRRRYPEAQIVRESSSGCLLRIPQAGENEITFNFHNLYSEIAACRPDTPEARAEIYRLKLDALDEAIRRGSGPLDLDVESGHIRPRLATPAMLASFTTANKGTDLPHTPLAGTGLSVVYVLDDKDSVMYLTQQHIEELGIDLPSIHARALENLRPSFPGQSVRGAAAGKEVHMIKMLDTYDAARLLLVPEHLHEGEAVAAIVSDRDTLALSPIPTNDDWSDLAKLAQTPASEPALLTRPLKVTTEGFQLM